MSGVYLILMLYLQVGTAHTLYSYNLQTMDPKAYMRMNGVYLILMLYLQVGTAHTFNSFNLQTKDL